MSDPIVSGTDLNFEQDVLDAQGPILLWFRAQWCGPCTATSSMIRDLAESYPEVRVVGIDVDEQPEIPVNYGVKALPTVLLMYDGDVSERVSGATERDRFERLFQQAHRHLADDAV